MLVGLVLVVFFWWLWGFEGGLVALLGYILGEILFPDKKPWQK